MVQQHHVSRQVLVLGPESVRDPGPETRITLPDETRIHLQQTRAVRETVGIRAADHGDVVDLAPEMWIKIGNLDAGLSVLRKLARRAEQRTRLANLEQWIAIEIRHGLAVTFHQLGLGIERVHLARAAVHE